MQSDNGIVSTRENLKKAADEIGEGADFAARLTAAKAALEKARRPTTGQYVRETASQFVRIKTRACAAKLIALIQYLANLCTYPPAFGEIVVAIEEPAHFMIVCCRLREQAPLVTAPRSKEKWPILCTMAARVGSFAEIVETLDDAGVHISHKQLVLLKKETKEILRLVL